MNNAAKNPEQLSPVKQALLAVKEMRAKIDALEQERTEPVAIIGMSCRFPGGASSTEAFWQLLQSGGDAIREVPPERWESNAYYDPDPEAPGKMITCQGGFLQGIEAFDAPFFGISPREAISMDPQHRLLLEVSWEALEAAGQVPDKLFKTQTGVFIGITGNDYAQRLRQQARYLDAYFITGNALNAAAGRLSYHLGLQGPALAVDTACSSSLVALHLACQSIHANDCTMALVGGVNAILSPATSIAASRGRMIAPDGRCKTFDASANGFVRGEGCGVIVLKRYSAAVADHDPILALVLGSAVNQDGPSSGLSVPNGLAQQALLREALDRSRVKATQVSYIEAHGTGTSLGDPIEVEALGAVYGPGRSATEPLTIGSVKTNIGHLESAAGIAGVIKTVLCLQQKKFSPHLHLQTINPQLHLDAIPATIPTQEKPWPAYQNRRIAGVSAFGVSGTNAHIILEEAREPEESASLSTLPAKSTDTLPENYLLPLSARSHQALKDLARSYLHLFQRTDTTASLHDICSTASTRRNHHQYRLTVVGNTQEQLSQHLTHFLEHIPSTSWAEGQVKTRGSGRIVFVFPGQGGQWIGMGQQLIRQEPVFLEALQRCEEAFHPYVHWSLLEELNKDAEQTCMARIDILQPALFAIQVALVALWRHWGIEPAAVVGHSMGEVAAAYVAGALSLDNASHIICTRSLQLCTVSGKGAMAVVNMTYAQTLEALRPYANRLSIAVSNSPFETVVSGEKEALQNLQEALQEQSISCTFIKVDVASHSSQMDPLLGTLYSTLRGIEPALSRIPLYSTVSGTLMDTTELDASYWVSNLREPVLFADTIGTMLQAGYTHFVELSPHPLLTMPIEVCLEQYEEKENALVTSSLRRGQDERQALYSTLALLYCRGYSVNWSHCVGNGRCVPLPSYPWQHSSYWPDSPPTSQMLEVVPERTQRQVTGQHPFLGARLSSPLSVLQFERDFTPSDPTFLDDHLIYTTELAAAITVVAGTSHIALALTAARDILGAQNCRLDEVYLLEPLIIPEGERRKVQFILTPQKHATYRFETFSLPPEDEEQSGASSWTLHATGLIVVDASKLETGARFVERALLQARCQQELSVDVLYADYWNVGYHFGPEFRWLQQLWRGEREAIAQMRLPQPGDHVEDFALPPGLIDSCCQIIVGFGLFDRQSSSVFGRDTLYSPVSVKQVNYYGNPTGSQLWAYGKLYEGDPQKKDAQEIIGGDIILCTADGRIVAEILHVRLKMVNLRVLLRNLNKIESSWLYEFAWRAQPLALPSSSAQGHWLILADAGGVGETLARELEHLGGHCHLFFTHASAHNKQQTDEGEQHYRAIRAALDEPAIQWQGIVHAWSLDMAPLCAEEGIQQELAGEEGWESILTLLHDLLQKSKTSHVPRLWLFTQGAYTLNTRQVAIEQSTVWGLGRVISLEHPDLWGGLIDLDPENPCQDLSHIAAELCAPDREEQLLFRSGNRYVARLAQRKLPPLPPVEQNLLRDDASYLITGGLGGLGLCCAQWMATAGARHLVLLGRGQPTSHAASQVKELQRQGIAVTIVMADVGQEEQLQQALARITAECPPLRGIIHAAGVLDDGMLLNQNRERFRQVLRPKVSGAWNLHRFTQQIPLDFFVLFSAAASLIGDAGQGNYATANAFLDALAAYRHTLGLTALSINWGPWAETGLVTTQRMKEHIKAQGLDLIPPQQGIQILASLLRDTHAIQVAVLPLHRAEFTRQLSRGRAQLFSLLFQNNALQEHAALTQQLQFAQKLQNAHPRARAALLSEQLQLLIRKVLHLDADTFIDPQRPLQELGFDSLMSVEIRNLLRTALGQSLPATLVFDYPTVTAMTAYLLSRIGEDEQVNTSQKSDPAASTASDQQTNLHADIAQLSDDELSAILMTFTEN